MCLGNLCITLKLTLQHKVNPMAITLFDHHPIFTGFFTVKGLNFKHLLPDQIKCDSELMIFFVFVQISLSNVGTHWVYLNIPRVPEKVNPLKKNQKNKNKNRFGTI